MQIFERDDRVNFIDEKNVCVDYELGQQCCEYANWFISPLVHSTLPPDVTDEWLATMNRSLDWPGYHFDRNYKQIIIIPDQETNLAIFRLTKPKAENMFLHLFNLHNGYYCHNFEWKYHDEVEFTECL